jgi:taurine dioxygenase
MAQAMEKAASRRTLETHILSGALGVEIRGVDLSKPLDTARFGEIRELYNQNVVILFRDQKLEPAHLVRFIEGFGAAEPHPLGSRRGLEGFPQVMLLENAKGKLGPRNDIWHSDISYGEVPPLGSALYAITVTEGRADTMFCNMYAAYEALSPGLRRTLDSLRAVHTAEPLVREVPSRLSVKVAPPGVEHPVVRTHPETGRKALYVNPWYTTHFVGWTAEESRPLLEYLTAIATQHENIYRHHWRVGDFLMWDNRSAMHYGVRDYDDTMPRLLWRVTAAGDRPR